VRFAAHVPSAGTYRLFLDFSHRGVVRTAAYTVEVPPGPGPAAPPSEAAGHGDGGADAHAH
jgi:hypothetical protein